MRTIAVFVALSFATANVKASPPEYDNDPFGDADFEQAPLILEVSHPRRGHGDLSLLFATSLVDKYNSHMGGLLDFTYHFTETLGLGLTVGFLHGQLTNIVTDDLGIIGNGVTACRNDQERCASIDANVPDYKQVTGMAEAVAVWTPLYGKFNIVSEIDLNMQIYGLAGIGINGTRTIAAASSPASPGGYTLSGKAPFAGGAFDNMKLNGTLGVGIKVHLLRWLALRAEVRDLVFRDKFAFNESGGPVGYWSSTWFGHVGLSFNLF